jgi:hypothetical protein
MAPANPENPPKDTKDLKKELPLGKGKDGKDDKKKDDPKEGAGFCAVWLR